MIMKKYVAPEMEVVLLGDATGMIFAASQQSVSDQPQLFNYETGNNYNGTSETGEWGLDLTGALGAVHDGAAADGSVWTEPAGDANDSMVPDLLVPQFTAPDVTAPDATIPEGILPDAGAADLVAPDVTVPEVVAPDAGALDWTNGEAAEASSEFGAE